MIIIADIHGRTFWKQSLIEKGILVDGKLTEEVLFMGDYLDHYNHEYDPIAKDYITSDSELTNFKEIINFKKENELLVTLLLGNHDMEYISDYCADCRMNYKHKDEIKDLFIKNIDLFRIGTFYRVDDKLVTFTHANICPEWIKSIQPLLKKLGYEDWMPTKDNGRAICEGIISLINLLISRASTDRSNLDTIGRLLSHIGYGRGGGYSAGSLVWSDLHDYLSDDIVWDDIYQVVAHTQHLVENDKFVCSEYTICVDCHYNTIGVRPLFRLNNKWEPISNTRDTLSCLKMV